MCRIILLIVVCIFSGAPGRAVASPIDIAHTPFARLAQGMTSMDIAIHGVRLGMRF